MPRKKQKERRRPRGFGSVVKKVSRGYVVFKPKIVVDGVVHWGEGVGWRRPIETEDEARARAQEKLKGLLADLAADRLVAPDARRLTVGELCRAWLAMIDGSKRAPLTKREYRKRLEAALLPELASLRVIDLRPVHLDGANGLYARLRAKDVASSSLMYAHDYLHAALRWGAKRRGVPVHRSILDGAVEAPVHRGKPKRPATAVEAERLIEVLAPPFGVEIATMYYAGLRDSEAAALKWRDVGTDGLNVERKRDPRTGEEGGVPKHGSEGWVPVVPQLRELLRRQRAWATAQGHPVGPDDWVFGYHWQSGPRAKRGAFLPPAHSTTCARIKEACRREGLADDLSAHSFRHAFAEAIRRARVDPRTGSDMLRHADPALMLRTYQHPDREQMSKAARKMGRAFAQPAKEGRK
ncbi:MAG TPA: tyrosine-type recombinase/integrase [Chloroflexota bacterium]